MPSIQPPTVGRGLWYHPSEYDRTGPGGMAAGTLQPLAATVIAVWGDRTVNVHIIDANGKPFYRPSCTLVQPGDKSPLVGAYVTWPVIVPPTPAEPKHPVLAGVEAMNPPA